MSSQSPSPLFDDSGRSVQVYQSIKGHHHLVITPSNSKFTYIVTLDPVTGSPMYQGLEGYDIFDRRDNAIYRVTEELQSKLKMEGKYLIGLASCDGATSLGLIKNADVTGWLPGGHTILTVREVSFYHINLKGKSSPFEQFQIVDNHYFCETYDLTSLFPSQRPASDPDPEFIWNAVWRKPFQALNLSNCCISLIQGVVASTTPPDRDFSMTYILRRSSLNPGTRYNARGLNHTNSPGNEVECEIIFDRGGEFSTLRWRRGSVPIQWETVLSSSFSGPKHLVKEGCIKGTVEYFQKLKKRYSDARINCMSLLESKTKSAENELYLAYKNAIADISQAVEDVLIYHFDVNKLLHSSTSIQTFNDFCDFIGGISEDLNFTRGKLPEEVSEVQRELYRFNCADSLDRTNLVTFYYSLIMTSKWLAEEGINKDLNKPIQEQIGQDVLDFMAKVFVESGNVVARMYTNTPAIKIEAIREFSSAAPSLPSDRTTTVQRRLENVMNDPQRQAIIENWVNPVEISWRYNIHPMYLSFNESSLNHLLWSDQTEAKIDSATLVLPFNMFPESLSMTIYSDTPSVTVKVTGGITMDNTDLHEEFELPIAHNKVRCNFKFKTQGVPCRFLTLNCGNVSVGSIGLSASMANYCLSIPTEMADSTTSEAVVQNFLRSSKSVFDAINLEVNRQWLRFDISLREKMAMEAGINPWFTDAYARIVGSPPNQCVLCRKPSNSHSHMSKYFPGLLSSKGYKEVPICTGCNEEVISLEIKENAFVDASYRSIKQALPYSSIAKTSSERSLLTGGCISVLKRRIPGVGDASLLFSRDGTEFRLTEQRTTFDIQFFQLTCVTSMSIEKVCGDFTLVDSQKYTKNIVGNTVTYDTDQYDFGQSFSFTLETAGDCVIKSIQLYGKSVKEVQDSTPTIAQSTSQNKLTNSTYVAPLFDPNTRTETHIIHPIGTVEEIHILPSNNKCNSELAFFFMRNGVLVGTRRISIPDIDQVNTTLIYKSGCTSEADKVKVAYIDPTETVQQRNIAFITIKSKST